MTTLRTLDKYRVDHLLSTAYYVPDFIDRQEERYLLDKILTEAKLEDERIGFRQLESRALKNYGGDIITKQGEKATSTLVPLPLPDFLTTFPPVLKRLQELGIFAESPHSKPNHILVNIYQPGQGIAAHQDGPAYHPVVATLSLGGQSLLDYLAYEDGTTGQGGRSIKIEPVLSVLQEPRSLLVTTNELYWNHLHTMPATPYDNCAIRRIANWHLLSNETRQLVETSGRQGIPRSLRVSLTYRDVKKVARVLSLKR